MTNRFRRYRMAPGLATVLGELGESATSLDLNARLKTLIERPAAPRGGEELERVLEAYLWLLGRAAEPSGIALTAAGWMKPAVVKEFAPVLPTMDDWIFAVTNESNVQPIAHFREVLQSMRLLRKYKSSLRLTKAGTAALEDPSELWRFLAERLVPDDHPFTTSLAVVLLLHAATTDGEVDLDEIARVMNELGWNSGGDPLEGRDVYPLWNSLWPIYGNVGRTGSKRSVRSRVPSPAAVALIRDALLTEVPV